MFPDLYGELCWVYVFFSFFPLLASFFNLGRIMLRSFFSHTNIYIYIIENKRKEIKIIIIKKKV
jgi:hypothetical protein